MSGRYAMTRQDGEIGSVWYVVDTAAPEREQPAILASYAGPGAMSAALMKMDDANERARRSAEECPEAYVTA